MAKVVSMLFAAVAGVAVGGGLTYLLTRPQILADHQRIVANMTIAFNIEGQQPIYSTPECVYSKTVTWGIQTTPLSVSLFTPGKEYQYSIWLWKAQDEIQYYMQIWGPDETGNYDIQIARNYAPPFTVTYKGATIIQAGRSSGVQEGSVWVFPECLYVFSVVL